MKILLIIPRYNLTNKVNYQYTFPLGLGYISSVLKQKGYDVKCLNLNHLNGAIESIITMALNRKKYDFVCTGHMAMGYGAIEKIIKAVKIHNSKPRVIIGGSLVTSEPELMFKSLKPDFAVIGEGEKTIIELLKCLENKENLQKVNGIIYMDNKKIVFTKPREVIKNIDSLPFPDFEGFGFNEQLENVNSAEAYNVLDCLRAYPILCSRGCPYQCTFCYHSLGPKYRIRSINNIMKELKLAFEKYKINYILTYDDLFSLDKERLREFCKRLKKLISEVSWECKWSCQLSVNSVDKETLTILKDAGCHLISYGFESYSPKVLKSMKKPINPEQIDNAIKLTREAGLSIQGNFIFGDIAETKETAYETLNYWKENCKGQIQIGFIQPYPGSAIYDYCIKKGIIKDKLYFIKNKITHTNWFNMTETMTDKEILQLKKDIVEARIKYDCYVTPLKTRKTGKKRYTLQVKCPYCKKTTDYKNCYLHNQFHYIIRLGCRNCHMRFNVVSSLYKFETSHYQRLDFLRRNYLLIRDRLLKESL